MPNPEPILLIGAGGDAAEYREPVLSSIAAVRPVVLVDSAVPGWTRPYLTGHVSADLTDQTATSLAVKAYTADHEAGGAMAYMEHHVVTAAHLAQQLGLPGSTPESMQACRDKALSRKLLADHQVPSARSMQAANPDEAVAHADLIGYPVVVKPRSQAGSAGVVRADNAAQVRAAFERAAHESVLGLDRFGERDVLVEEFLDGPEISVETAVLGEGEARLLAVTRKLPTPAGAATTQEYGHVVDARDPLLTDPQLTRVVTGAVHALGLTCGVLCIEVKLTQTGPRIVEVNGRIGGDLLPVLVERALGLDLAQIAAALATGSRPQLTPTLKRAAGIQFAYPTVSGVLKHLSLPAHLDRQPGVERIVLSQQAGARVSAPPHATLADRLGFWIVRGDTAADCRSRLEDVARQLQAEVASDIYATT
ncbi:ATP-grasp domain-containing protein [Streptomyces bobili]|uniref:ATP-grasp domain-containing protein n=1 Tax=Streptomyces bobili TaxID=67280 RepID=UPI0034466888